MALDALNHLGTSIMQEYLPEEYVSSTSSPVLISPLGDLVKIVLFNKIYCERVGKYNFFVVLISQEWHRMVQLMAKVMLE